MVVAIDGPAAAGKSTVARALAERLGFVYVDTGAMYRAIALSALRRGIDLSDGPALESLAASADLRFLPNQRLLSEGEDVTDSLRTPEVARAASVVSTVPGVRRAMVELQRRLGREGSIVMEGRDIGSVVFPDAEVKVYLDATVEERARRRFGENPDGPPLEEVIAEIRDRDRRDRTREHSPLVRVAGALHIDCTEQSAAEVVERILRNVR